MKIAIWFRRKTRVDFAAILSIFEVFVNDIFDKIGAHRRRTLATHMPSSKTKRHFWLERLKEPDQISTVNFVKEEAPLFHENPLIMPLIS